MPLPEHSEWANQWEQIRNESGVIQGCHCLICNNNYKRHDAPFMCQHRRKCTPERPRKRRRSYNFNNENVSPKPTQSFENESPAAVGRMSVSPSNCSQQVLHSLVSQKTMQSTGTTNSTCIENNQICHKEKIESVVKFFLLGHFRSEHIKDHHLKEFFEVIDPTINAPTLEIFETTLLKETLIGIWKRAKSFEYRNTMVVLSHKNENRISLISLALTQDDKYIFINFKEVINDDEITNNICSFVESSMKMVFRRLKIIFKYVVYDIDIKLPTVLTLQDIGSDIDQIKCILTCCFSILTTFLKSQKMSISGTEQLATLNEYYNNLQLLDKKFESSSIADASELVMDFVEKYNDLFCNSRNTLCTIRNYLSPFGSTCSFFHSVYGGAQFLDVPELKKEMNDFLYEVLPHDVKLFESIAYYKRKSKTFELLFKGNHDNNNFWQSAKREHEELSEWATEVANIPAVSRKIDVDKCVRFVENSRFRNHDNIHDHLLFSCYINER